MMALATLALSAFVFAVGALLHARFSRPAYWPAVCAPGRHSALTSRQPTRELAPQPVINYQCDQRVQIVQVFPTMPAPVAARSPLELDEVRPVLQALPLHGEPAYEMTDQRELRR